MDVIWPDNTAWGEDICESTVSTRPWAPSCLVTDGVREGMRCPIGPNRHYTSSYSCVFLFCAVARGRFATFMVPLE